jgi:hypothetical protein
MNVVAIYEVYVAHASRNRSEQQRVLHEQLVELRIPFVGNSRRLAVVVKSREEQEVLALCDRIGAQVRVLGDTSSLDNDKPVAYVSTYPAFDDTDGWGHVIDFSLNSCMWSDADVGDILPWFSHQDRFGVSIACLRMMQSWLRERPMLFTHPLRNYCGMLVPSSIKAELTKAHLIGLAFEPVTPIVHFEELFEDATTPAQIEIPEINSVTRRLRSIEFGDYPADMEPWWVIVPTITLPPMNPQIVVSTLLERETQLYGVLPSHLDDPVRLKSKMFDKVPPIYTPEAVTATQAFDIAASFERFDYFGKYSRQIHFSSRAKEAFAPFIVEPRWSRVGILPVNSPVLGGN